MPDIRMRARLLALVFAALTTSTVARAQSADGFNPGANAGVDTLAVQPDGKILVGGAFTMLSGGGTGTTPRNFLGRLNADGSLDASFNPGANGEVYALTLQPDGKILVGGAFTMLGGGGSGTTPRNYLGRLNADGSLDATFNPGMNGAVYGVAVQVDGKILITGGFHTLGGGGTGTTAREFLGRLNANGSLDTTFNPGANYFAYAMAVQPDGKILLGGWFTMLGGGGSGTTPRNYIGRLNADGSLDTTFNPGANNYVTSLAVQPDGKILAGGSFTTLGGGGTGTTTRNRLGRLNADGSLDPTFNPGANDAVRALNLQVDGKVIVVGSFTSLGGGTGTTTRHNLGRINADGALDTSFDPGANGFWVFGLAMQPDGKMLVGGDFVTLGGGGTGTTSRAHIGRVTSGSAPIQSVAITNGGSTITWSRSGAGPEVSGVTFESSADAATYTSLGNGTRAAGGWQLNGLSLPAGNNLYIRARGYYGTNGWFSGSGSILESIRRVYTSCATITLSATVFANGTVGGAYPPTTVTQAGGVGVTTFTVTSGALPGGMSLSSAGVVSGTPNAAGTFNATLTATDANGCTGSRAYTVTIASSCSSVASSGTTFAAAGGNGSLAITAPAGCSWTVTNVPPWASTISGASGTGAGVWQYAVAANPGPLRSGTISAAGHEFVLRQLAGSVAPYGVWDDLAWEQGANVDYLIDKMVAAGVRNVRMAFRWYMIEPTQNQWSFAVHDDIVAKLRAHGIEILGLLEHPPDWAISGPPGITPPTNDADWQDYIAQVATHFRGQVANWEIWNEENLHYTWYPLPPDAVRYVQLLKIAFNTIRSVDPDATVVLGGLGNNGTFMGWEEPQDRYYLQKLYDAGGKDYFDVLNVHIYVHPITEGVNGLRTYLQDTHAVMSANGDAAKPVWLTETGWSLAPNGSTPNITETEQANLLTSIFTARASLGVERIYWFSFHDLPSDGDNYGMVRSNLSLRPSYYAFMGVTSSPTITTQPQSQTIASGQSATMTVVATGTPTLGYQWYAGTSGNTTSPIAGATSSSFTTPPLTSTASYWVRVTSGSTMTDSNTAVITVITCTYSLSAPSASVPSSISSGSLTLTASGSGCGWSAASNNAFITVTSPSGGTGTTTVTWATGANTTTSPRTGTITIAGLTFTITQAAASTARRVPNDFNHDGVSDLGVFRASLGRFLIAGQPNTDWGAAGDMPVAGDFNGDGNPDIAVFRPANGTWYISGGATIVWGAPGDIPVPGDYDGNGTTDIAVFRPSAGMFYIRNGASAAWGLAGDLPVVGDYNGDGRDDIAVYRPATGTWYIRNGATAVFGLAADIPVPADYNGDGLTDIAVFRPATGTWFIKDQYTQVWGARGDVPVPLDRDGDGRADLGVFRRAGGIWYFKNHLSDASETVAFGTIGDLPLGRALPAVQTPWGDYDGDRKADLTVFRPSTGDWVSLRSLSGMTDYTLRTWGISTDLPVGRDYDGDGKIDPAVYRPALGRWFVLQSSSGYSAYIAQDWGLSTDTPVPADYDGDGKADLAVFRPSIGRWVILLSSSNNTSYVLYDWGLSGDIPVPADFDGDGRADIAVFRPSTGRWYVLNRLTGAFTVNDWGLNGDVPVAADFDGDGKADITVFRPSTGRWYVFNRLTGASTVYDWGLNGDYAVPADYDSDGKADVAVYRPSNGTWYVRGLFNQSWGLSTDIPALKNP